MGYGHRLAASTGNSEQTIRIKYYYVTATTRILLYVIYINNVLNSRYIYFKILMINL